MTSDLNSVQRSGSCVRATAETTAMRTRALHTGERRMGTIIRPQTFQDHDDIVTIVSRGCIQKCELSRR